jgi:hypothetical protein
MLVGSGSRLDVGAQLASTTAGRSRLEGKVLLISWNSSRPKALGRAAHFKWSKLQRKNLRIAGEQASCGATNGALIPADSGDLTMGKILSTT